MPCNQILYYMQMRCKFTQTYQKINRKCNTPDKRQHRREPFFQSAVFAKENVGQRFSVVWMASDDNHGDNQQTVQKSQPPAIADYCVQKVDDPNAKLLKIYFNKLKTTRPQKDLFNVGLVLVTSVVSGRPSTQAKMHVKNAIVVLHGFKFFELMDMMPLITECQTASCNYNN